MTCEFCRRTQKDGFTDIKCDGIETIDECLREQDKIPKLSKDNKRFVIFCEENNYDYESINMAMDVFNIPLDERLIIRQRFMCIMNVIAEIRTKNNK